MFSFRDLNLSGVEIAAPSMAPGNYIAKVVKASVEKTRTGGAQVVVVLKEIETGAMITDYINVYVPSSEEAQNIGKSRLKALLAYGGHKNPDEPGDINSLRNLTVGIRVIEEEYEKDGVKKKGTKLARSGAYFDPKGDGNETTQSSGSSSGGGGRKTDLDDDIPFE